ncbi:hypothetical protein FB45DRAFT_714184, partial [Roridomyces roridus]
RYFGKSSSRSFLIDIMGMKIFNESTNKQTFNAQRPEFWDPKPVSSSFSSLSPLTEEKWHDMVEEAIPPPSFPEDDLLTPLIDLYFERINPLMGLLHAPSFRRSISQGEHLSDLHFGSVVLLVCALAARCSDDPRVLLDQEPHQGSAGWKWFRQVRPLWMAATFQTFRFSLYKLQVICVRLPF